MGLVTIKAVKYLFLMEPVYSESVFRRLRALPSKKRAIFSTTRSENTRLVFRVSPHPLPRLGSPASQHLGGFAASGHLPGARQGGQCIACTEAPSRQQGTPLSSEQTEHEVEPGRGAHPKPHRWSPRSQGGPQTHVLSSEEVGTLWR